MNNLFIDCSGGIAGDMLLAALFDIGVPFKVVHESLVKVGIANKCSLEIEKSHSLGLQGSKVLIEPLENNFSKTSWLDIKDLITKSNLDEVVKIKVLKVFEVLAKAEAAVHGTDTNKVHFHEIGSIETIVDIIGVCTALNYLELNKIFCTFPPSGSGSVNTEHGLLPVPVPVVLELAKNHQITLSGTKEDNLGELTTPTGLALLIIFADYFSQPKSFLIKSIGVGLGNRELNRPNLLRICELEDSGKLFLDQSPKGLTKANVVLQEAWIDDSSGEDLALLVNRLKRSGALEVVSHSIQMKKGRNGIAIKALVRPEDAEKIRFIWFSNGTTIGLRERLEERWLLLRRIGTCSTKYGKVIAKQVKRPDGRNTLKPESDELSRLSSQHGVSLEDIRHEVLNQADSFMPEEDWKC